MSGLAEIAQDYLRLRRSLGHKLAGAGRLLPRFVAFLDAAGAPTVTTELALAWAQQPDAKPGSYVHGQRMTIARGFARHLAGIDGRTEIPPLGLLPMPRMHRRNPYLYSKSDVAALLDQARTTLRPALRAATYETLIGLLAVTGMRVGEALRLDLRDVDLASGVITVLDTKFGKTRQLPLHTSTVQALSAYADRRDAFPRSAETSSFFVSLAGTRMLYVSVHATFQKLLTQTGVGNASVVVPRLHDLRHSFAVATLITWYRNGDDVQARLPWLSTYLGHSEPRYTYGYLSAAPELLTLATQRLEEIAGNTR